MQLEHNKSLKDYNTFGIDAKASEFVSITTLEQLHDVVSLSPKKRLFILGGGSNMLLTTTLDARVVHINIKGIDIHEESEEAVVLDVMAGENWHELVLHCVNEGYGGIENLSLIPGNVGAAPIQNIGAYGVELKDVFVSCEALDLEANELRTFNIDECQFGYRNSIFKQDAKGKYVIVSVRIELTKEGFHKLNTSYGAIVDTLAEMNIADPGIKDISDAVIAIRKSKLPDPAEIGNSGSFFKNPVIDKASFNKLMDAYPETPYYELNANQYKIPAGWLIQTAGYKGIRRGDAGVHDKQALVLVNHGDAKGQEILELAMEIQEQIKKQFNIVLEREVNVI